MPLEQYLEELMDPERPIRHVGLLGLSGLSSAELNSLKRRWVRLEVSRRRQVVSRLVELAEESVELDFSGVFRLCLHDPDEEVREKAVSGLWESEDRSLILSFINLLKHDGSPRVRAASAISLGEFASLAEEGKLLERDGARIRDALLVVVGNPHEPVEVRRRALEAVAPFQTPEVKRYIQEAYESADSLLRHSAVYAMGRSGDLQWLPVILQELSSDDPAMRYEAANASGEMGEGAAIPQLIPLIQDEDLQVQLSAIRALGNIGGPLAKRSLQECLKSDEEPLREAAAEALRHLEIEDDPLAFKFES